MQVIALASQKGGSGKTTLAGHLAVEAGSAGFGPVALLDTDPQGSLAAWWNQREQALPLLVRSDARSVEGDLQRLYEQGYSLAVIDTPPAASTAISEVARVSDLVIVPCRPSPHDLRAVGATVDLVEAWDKPMLFVVNSATRRARITAEAAVALSQHGTVSPVTVHHRVDFAASMIDGRTVMETSPNSASAKEIVALWQYVNERMTKLFGPIPASAQTNAPTVAPVHSMQQQASQFNAEQPQTPASKPAEAHSRELGYAAPRSGPPRPTASVPEHRAAFVHRRNSGESR